MKIILAAAIVATLTGCAPMNADKARRAVEAVGVTDVQINGIAILGCGEKDMFRSKFTGKDSKGNPVSGAVCGGFFKGATVRFD